MTEVFMQARSPSDRVSQTLGPRSSPIFGPYELVELIGRSATAELFRARRRGAPAFAPPWVVKRLRSEVAASPDLIQMLEDEARILALLRHPNIVRLHEHGSVDGTAYLALEHLEGHSLSVTLRRLDTLGRWPHVVVAAHIAHQVAEALAYAHGATDQHGRPLGVVHRDVSPGNIMLLRSGAVKLVDFGIAKAARHVRQTWTEVDIVKGTAAYMAPEQVSGGGSLIDHRADLFSLGIVLWEMLAGQPLFRGPSPIETAALVRVGPVPRLSAIRADVPVLLEAIAMRALERDPGRRYQTAADLAADLGAWLKKHPAGTHSMATQVAALVAETAEDRPRAPTQAAPPPPPPSRRTLLPPPPAARESVASSAPPNPDLIDTRVDRPVSRPSTAPVSSSASLPPLLAAITLPPLMPLPTPPPARWTAGRARPAGVIRRRPWLITGLVALVIGALAWLIPFALTPSVAELTPPTIDARLPAKPSGPIIEPLPSARPRGRRGR
jgi:serine/threonine-protein kinase